MTLHMPCPKNLQDFPSPHTRRPESVRLVSDSISHVDDTPAGTPGVRLSEFATLPSARCRVMKRAD
ncbi:MAG: hypothetical protein KGJ78_02130 [Alphaproteobacteria bacterium]|nr:hypothetical protein [Alphaproteobacteria bacterium]